jgi:hypothetical protein
MACGDGDCEAQNILGMLDLPNKTTTEKKTCSYVERSIAPHIKAMAMQYLNDSLLNEVLLTA